MRRSSVRIFQQWCWAARGRTSQRSSWQVHLPHAQGTWFSMRRKAFSKRFENGGSRWQRLPPFCGATEWRRRECASARRDRRCSFSDRGDCSLLAVSPEPFSTKYMLVLGSARQRQRPEGVSPAPRRESRCARRPRHDPRPPRPRSTVASRATRAKKLRAQRGPRTKIERPPSSRLISAAHEHQKVRVPLQLVVSGLVMSQRYSTHT